MKWSAVLVALVPFGPVTVTSTIAEPAGEARNTQARYNVRPTATIDTLVGCAENPWRPLIFRPIARAPRDSAARAIRLYRFLEFALAVGRAVRDAAPDSADGRICYERRLGLLRGSYYHYGNTDFCRARAIEQTEAGHHGRSDGKYLAMVCGDWCGRPQANQACFAAEASCIC